MSRELMDGLVDEITRTTPGWDTLLPEDHVLAGQRVQQAIQQAIQQAATQTRSELMAAVDLPPPAADDRTDRFHPMLKERAEDYLAHSMTVAAQGAAGRSTAASASAAPGSRVAGPPSHSSRRVQR